MGEGPHRFIGWVGSALLVSLLAALLLDLGTARAESPDGSIGAAAALSTRAGEPASSPAAQPPGAARYASGKVFRTLPIVFEANRGQVDQSVRFLSRGSGHTLFLTDSEAVLVLARALAPSPGNSPVGVPDESDSAQPAVLRMKLVGANRGPGMAGLEKLPGKVNYLIGDDPARWHQNVPTYARVRYAEVYPGVDLIYYGTQGRLEYDFVLAPGANPDVIALELEGAESLAVSDDGDLVLAVPGGELRMRKPYVYQDVDGRRQPIDARYVLQDGGRIGFRVAAYDARQALVIDPVLGYSSYLGGSGNDQAFAVATDGTGHAYLTGRTFSANFPTLAAPPASAPYQGTPKGDSDVFVAKINTKAAGTGSLVYSTYVGGSKNEVGNGIAVDGAGNAYVTGQTFSTANFPAKPLKSGNKGASDGFIFKLNPAGSALLYSVYIGGSGDDSGLAIAVNSNRASVTGVTTSSNFPTTSGAYDTTSGGGQDAFVARLKDDGTALDYSTYLGGAGSDAGRGIAVDASGALYVTGVTSSSDFPKQRAFQGELGGGVGQDAFVTKLNPATPGASGLVYSTFLGGSQNDAGNSIAVDVDTGLIYVTGVTSSGAFPITPGAFQSVFGGGDTDAFVTKLNPATPGAPSLVYSTFLGGAGNDIGSGIAVLSGNAYVTGSTGSVSFPGPISGGTDAFVAKLHPGGAGLSDLVLYTFLGGGGFDAAYGIAVNAPADAYVVGETASDDFPTVNAFDALGVGVSDASRDAFVAWLTLVTPPVLTSPGDRTVNELTTLSFTLSATDPDGQTITYSISSGEIDGMSLGPGTGVFTWTPTEAQGPGTFDVTLRATNSLGAFDEKSITITVNEVHQPPVLSGVPAAVTIDESVLYTFTAAATDADLPAQTLTFSLVGAPAGATIHAATGVFSWTPTEAQGPGNYTFAVRVTDSGAVGESQITITVTDVNNAPVLTSPGDKTVDELSTLSFTLSATDPDLPANTLSYSMNAGSQVGMTLDASSGVFTWTPTEGQGPGQYQVTFRVTDNGTPPQFDEKTITITVNEVNSVPVLTSPGDKTVNELSALSFTLSASDPDLPANTLTYSISGGSQVGMTLNASSGAFSWTPGEAQGPGQYPVTFRVTDNGTPPLFDEKTIAITVGDVNAPPVLTVPPSPTIQEGASLSFVASASDPDLPANTLTVFATNLPAGATFDGQTFNWKPTSAQGGPNLYPVYFTISDGQLFETKTVSITVFDTIVDLDQDGVPDPPGFDLDGNGSISPPGVRNAQGQFEHDNCPDSFNPDQADVCHSDTGATAASSISASSVTGELMLTLSVTFDGGSSGFCVVPVDLFNSICTLKDSTGAEVPLGGVPEAPPINLVPVSGPDPVPGHLFCIDPGATKTLTTTFALNLFYPNLPDGNYTLDCQYVNFAHNPNPEPDDPNVWMGIVQAPLQNIFVGELVFSGFSSPADHEPFNRGRTVPVKFVLRDSSGALITTATPQLFVQRLDAQENPIGDPIPATSTGSCCTGNIVPFNTGDNQYHYNMRTQPLEVGPWQLQLKPGDGTTHTITIVIR